MLRRESRELDPAVVHAPIPDGSVLRLSRQARPGREEDRADDGACAASLAVRRDGRRRLCRRPHELTGTSRRRRSVMSGQRVIAGTAEALRGQAAADPGGPVTWLAGGGEDGGALRGSRCRLCPWRW